MSYQYINSLSEIKRETAPLFAMSVGRATLIKKWAEENFDDYVIKDGVIYPNEDEMISDRRTKIFPPYVKVAVFKTFEHVRINDVLHPDKELIVEKIPYDSAGLSDDMKHLGKMKYSMDVHTATLLKINFVKAKTSDGELLIVPYDKHSGDVCVYVWEGPDS